MAVEKLNNPYLEARQTNIESYAGRSVFLALAEAPILSGDPSGDRTHTHQDYKVATNTATGSTQEGNLDNESDEDRQVNDDIDYE